MANKSQSIYQINNTAVKTHENCEDGKKFHAIDKNLYYY